MKHFVKILSATFLMTVMSLGVKAQVTENATASATVLSNLTLSKNSDINFGNISSSTPGVVVLDPTGNASANVGGTATVGKFTIGGGINASVKVTWPASAELVGTTDNTKKMVYSVLVHGKDTDDATGSAALGTVGIATTANVNLSGSGAYFLYVGGNLAPDGTAAGSGGALSNQATDTYTATLNFQVEYN